MQEFSLAICWRQRTPLLFEQNFEGEMDEGIEWLITLFRLRPDQSALPAIEEEGGKFVCFRGSRQVTPIYSGTQQSGDRLLPVTKGAAEQRLNSGTVLGDFDAHLADQTAANRTFLAIHRGQLVEVLAQAF